MVFCKDCKHVRKNITHESSHWTCSSPAIPLSLVTGTTTRALCENERLDSAYSGTRQCGREGRHFEQFVGKHD